MASSTLAWWAILLIVLLCCIVLVVFIILIVVIVRYCCCKSSAIHPDDDEDADSTSKSGQTSRDKAKMRQKETSPTTTQTLIPTQTVRQNSPPRHPGPNKDYSERSVDRLSQSSQASSQHSQQKQDKQSKQEQQPQPHQQQQPQQQQQQQPQHFARDRTENSEAPRQQRKQKQDKQSKEEQQAHQQQQQPQQLASDKAENSVAKDNKPDASNRVVRPTSSSQEPTQSLPVASPQSTLGASSSMAPGVITPSAVSLAATSVQGLPASKQRPTAVPEETVKQVASLNNKKEHRSILEQLPDMKVNSMNSAPGLKFKTSRNSTGLTSVD